MERIQGVLKEINSLDDVSDMTELIYQTGESTYVDTEAKATATSNDLETRAAVEIAVAEDSTAAASTNLPVDRINALKVKISVCYGTCTFIYHG